MGEVDTTRTKKRERDGGKGEPLDRLTYGTGYVTLAKMVKA